MSTTKDHKGARVIGVERINVILSDNGRWPDEEKLNEVMRKAGEQISQDIMEALFRGFDQGVRKASRLGVIDTTMRDVPEEYPALPEAIAINDDHRSSP